MPKVINIIGTDTEIGKTYTCCQIMRYLIKRGYKVAALKPIATGIIKTQFGFINEDVRNLLNSSNYKLLPKQINPFNFEVPVSPNIAAKQKLINLDVDQIIKLINPLITGTYCDYLLIEGIGGLMVPLNDTETYLDFLKRINFSTILVVGLKLGCLNHSILTLDALLKNEINCIGWVANLIDPKMQYISENVNFLQSKLTVPLLATIDYQDIINPKGPFIEKFK